METTKQHSAPKTGLVLEGGAMRGLYTAGVLDVMLELDIPVQLITGVSAGALFGVNYLSRQKGRVLRYCQKYNRDPSYMGLLPLLRTGNIISTEYAYERVPQQLDPFDTETFARSGIPFYAVLSNMDTGQPEYIQFKEGFAQMDVLRASGSMPFVSRPVQIGQSRYLDGGITDSIPFQFALGQGCQRLLVILTRDLSYRKKPAAALPIRLFYRHLPIAEKMLDRHLRYNQSLDELARLEQEGTAYVIRPSRPLTIGRMEKDPAKMQEAYDLGRQDALHFFAGSGTCFIP